jgi:predicted TIM-barrel fold metal-dependent hydrolase
MDIVDSQVHSNVLGTETTLAIMDAIGIQSVLIDEYLRPDEKGSLLPGYRFAGGEFRPIGPGAEAAALAYPDRFQFLMRIDPFDPAPEPWIETLRVSPNLKALRIIIFTPAERAALESGGLDPILAAAHRNGLPVFITCPARVPYLRRYAEKFPELQFVIDHCGADFGAEWGKGSIDDTVAMADCPNVALKWAHAPGFLSAEAYPFADMGPQLRRAVDAFGRERVMWASDYTVSAHRQNWAESLFYLRHSPVLSEDDKEWILGRTARTLLNWPAPAEAMKPKSLHPHRLGPRPAQSSGTS